MIVEQFLSRLQKVRPNGPHKWTACCPAHDDKSPSLAIRELDDAKLLVYCFGGCGVDDILAAVGLEITDLFPERADTGSPAIRRPFIPTDVFNVLRHEAAIVAIIGADLHKGHEILENDYSRLFTAIERLNRISGAAYGG